MPIIFNLDPILRQIVSAKNKKFVKELQGEGMKEKRIEQILVSDYYKNIYPYNDTYGVTPSMASFRFRCER